MASDGAGLPGERKRPESLELDDGETESARSDSFLCLYLLDVTSHSVSFPVVRYLSLSFRVRQCLLFSSVPVRWATPDMGFKRKSPMITRLGVRHGEGASSWR